MESSGAKINVSEYNLTDQESVKDMKRDNKLYILSMGLPLLIILISVFGFVEVKSTKTLQSMKSNVFETSGKQIKNAGKYNILSSEDLSGKIKDTIYTDKDCWLELKINEQTLYQHWRDGTVQKYPVSTGNNKGGDPTALESRPGLFAIFVKVEHHKSSQFDASNMYHFMPFNQGIGFHSIDGTGYYAHLGVRPSSHGCIRMKHDDAKKLFKDCPLGTLVLATKNYSARTIAFAPEGFENERDYDKEEYKTMLASNLYNLVSGNYYLAEREKFIVDPKVIPVSGVYNGYDVSIPDRQILPRSFINYYASSDKLKTVNPKEIIEEKNSDEFIRMIVNDTDNSSINLTNENPADSRADLIKKYFNNPIGVLPYFGPKR